MKIKKLNIWSNINRFWRPKGICYLCRDTGLVGLDLCTHCYRDLPRPKQICVRCAAPLVDRVDSAMCGRCQASPPWFDATLAAFVYRHPIDKLVQRLKFDGDLTAARVLGHLSALRFKQLGDTLPQALVPVPLHILRLKQRGFNQAHEIAKTVARTHRLVCLNTLCERVKHTEEQSSLNARQRKANLSNAFQVNKAITFEHVAVVDDVMTTGHTANAIAKVLKQAGVKRVDIWVSARAQFSV